MIGCPPTAIDDDVSFRLQGNLSIGPLADEPVEPLNGRSRALGRLPGQDGCAELHDRAGSCRTEWQVDRSTCAERAADARAA